MPHWVTVLPQHLRLQAAQGETILSVLRTAGLMVDAPCGGNGTCGKCKVLVDGTQMLACQTVIDRDMTISLPTAPTAAALTKDISTSAAHNEGYGLAFDIGTTTVVGYLLAPGGKELARDSAVNPQVSFGADVISRIRHALSGQMEPLTDCILRCADKIARALCQKCGVFPQQIATIALVGNPAMQQLFLGILPQNLAQPPFAPMLTQGKRVPAAPYFPRFSNAELLVVPNISGFVGADTLACVLSTDMARQEQMTLLVDIGTNGEMVLGNCHTMVACSTAAGPALEGAGIQWGMRAMEGAIDHVHLQDGRFVCSVIGNSDPVGICGSGLIDAVAAALNGGLLNQRGRIENESRTIPLADQIQLTQDDIRQVQQAKGAIAAGIELMAEHLNIRLEEIERVYLAGAFGSYLNPGSACRVGLLPSVLEEKIVAVGNAAGSGAKLLIQDQQALERTDLLAAQIEHLDLASAPGFQRRFAQCMYFEDSVQYWCKKAKMLGFTEAAPLDISTLHPREDVRAMCAADQCGAYGKNWTCPPHCGTLAECGAKMQLYRHGILLQTVGTMEKTIDTKAYHRTEQRHLEQFHRLAAEIRKVYSNALCLGSGGCRICKTCAYPQTCRFPEKAHGSMEGYGLFVTQVCRDNGLAYHHGERTITYTACVLF
jgi:uncharacterized 2Fe-2S/4Fe-4S cluster protein (DUF4445 family)